MTEALRTGTRQVDIIRMDKDVTQASSPRLALALRSTAARIAVGVPARTGRYRTKWTQRGARMATVEQYS